MTDDVTALVAKVQQWKRLTDSLGTFAYIHGITKTADSMDVAAFADELAAALAERDAEIGSYQHESALIDADTQRGITDCSTPLFQRVRNIVEQLEQAEAALAACQREKDALTIIVADFQQAEREWQASHRVFGEPWQKRHDAERRVLAAALRPSPGERP